MFSKLSSAMASEPSCSLRLAPISWREEFVQRASGCSAKTSMRGVSTSDVAAKCSQKERKPLLMAQSRRPPSGGENCLNSFDDAPDMLNAVLPPSRTFQG